LTDALTREAVARLKNAACSYKINHEYLDAKVGTVPSSLYLEESNTQFDRSKAASEVTGCIRFLASLARVDGLVWLNSRLHLEAFGVEITATDDPVQARLGLNSSGKESRELDVNHYGTRHRSMLRYCAANAESVGFVVSQDGDIRAVTAANGSVFLWENIRTLTLKNAPVELPDF
jgi:hypothetical protein